MTVDEELANSCVIPLEYCDRRFHVINVYLSESPPSDYVYLRNTSLPAASVDFSDNRLNITFAPSNITGEVELYVPWNDFYTAVKFENGTFRNLQRTGYVAEIVLNPLESRSIELMHGNLLSEGLVFWTAIDVSIVDVSFNKSDSLKLHSNIQGEEPTFLAAYAPDYGMPTRVDISGNLFTRRCEDAEMFKEAHYNC